MKRNVNDWTLEQIRQMNTNYSSIIGWLEDTRWEWVPLFHNTIEHVMNGGTLLLYTDHNLSWFKEYVLNKINHKNNNRPLVAVYELSQSILKLMDPNTLQSSNIDNINMHLSVSFENYAFWYVGKYHYKHAKLALNSDNSLLWLLDEKYPNAFCLNSDDDKLPFKLLQLYDIFEIMLFGKMFDEFD